MFFSVKSAVRIAGKVYIPCVCYPLPDFLKATVEKMVNEGKAYIYAEKVAFQNGKVLEKKTKLEQPKIKKAKKEKKETIEEPVKEAEEEVPSPEEVADDLGGF